MRSSIDEICWRLRVRSCLAASRARVNSRIASWRAFHRMKNLDSPFDAPMIKQARAKARRAL